MCHHLNWHTAPTATEAADKADEMSEKGDLDGKVAWLRILRAVKELMLDRADKTVH